MVSDVFLPRLTLKRKRKTKTKRNGQDCWRGAARRAPLTPTPGEAPGFSEAVTPFYGPGGGRAYTDSVLDAIFEFWGV